MNRLGTRGDTIVEVLLAIAIVSAVLGGAYVSANRSLAGSTRSQERGEAIKLVEAQLELLKAAAPNDAADIFTRPPTFCFEGNNLIPTTLNVGDQCLVGPGDRYNLRITRGADDATFTGHAEWDPIGGGQLQELNIVYRVYDGS